MLNKYLSIAKITWQNSFVYRLNFIMWRVRAVIGVLALYFLWLAIFSNTSQILNYNQSQLLTYILIGAIIRSLVFSSQSTSIQSNIASGDLNNYLIRPLNYFSYWFFSDLADKLLNIIFAFIELTLIFFLLKPPLVFPSDPQSLTLFIIASFLAMIMYFYFSILVSLTTFWMPEHNGWPQRFFVFAVLEFMSGGLLPLDLLPQGVYKIISNLPTAHFLFTPLQMYLGRINGTQALTALLSMVLWIIILSQLARWLFKRGLKTYEAYGR